MWTVKPAPMPVQIYRGSISGGYSHPPPRIDDGINRRLCNIPRKSQSDDSVSGLGQQILLRSGESNPIKPEISGSDVLLAIQRATAQRKNKKKKTEIRDVQLLSTAGESTGDNGVDYSNVRPLMIKNDWGQRLDEFEKLLKEFQDMEL